MVEALTAGTPLLHLTGQIESEYLDRDLGFIHEHPAQLAMLQAVGKAAFRIRNPETALATLREAHRLAFTPPCDRSNEAGSERQVVRPDFDEDGFGGVAFGDVDVEVVGEVADSGAFVVVAVDARPEDTPGPVEAERRHRIDRLAATA
jgi:acetolactate synthase-1/2/3 large subunit